MASLWDNQVFQPPVTSGNLYFQPGSTYGAPTSWSNTEVGQMLREQNPDLAYSQYGQRIGVADSDNAFNRWFYQQVPRFQRAYGMATIENPMMRIDDFLATLPGLQALQQQFNMSSPSARGLSYGTYAPQVRWINR